MWEAVVGREVEMCVRRKYFHNILYTYKKSQNIKATKNKVNLIPMPSHITAKFKQIRFDLNNN